MRRNWSKWKTIFHWLRHYMAAIKSMPADLSSEQKVERFLTELETKCFRCHPKRAFNAILYFYKEVIGQRVTVLRVSDGVQCGLGGRSRDGGFFAEHGFFSLFLGD